MDSPCVFRSLREGLLEEHVVIGRLLARVITAVESRDNDAAENAWIRFQIALLARLQAEDTQLVSALPRAYATNALVLGREHGHLRHRVAELNAAAPHEAKHLGELRVLRDILEAHARNDDRLLYAWVEAQLGDLPRATAIDGLARRLEQLADESGV